MPITLDWIKVESFMALRGIEDISDLAEKAETHKSNMYRMRTGEGLPNMETLARMCLFLGCQPGDILAYQHSENDITQPYLLFGSYKVDMKSWQKFRKADKKWRTEALLWRANEWFYQDADGPEFDSHQATADRMRREALAKNWLASDVVDSWDRAEQMLSGEVIGGHSEAEVRRAWEEIHALAGSPENEEAQELLIEYKEGDLDIDSADLDQWRLIRDGLENFRDRKMLEAYGWDRESVGAEACKFNVYIGDLDYELKVVNTRIDRAEKKEVARATVAELRESLGSDDDLVNRISVGLSEKGAMPHLKVITKDSDELKDQ